MAAPVNLPVPPSVATAVVTVTETVTSTVTAAARTLVERQVNNDLREVSSQLYYNGVTASRQAASMIDKLVTLGYTQHNQYMAVSRMGVNAEAAADNSHAIVIEVAVLIVVVAIMCLAMLITLAIIAHRLKKSNWSTTHGSTPLNASYGAGQPHMVHHNPNGVVGATDTKTYGTTSAHEYGTTPHLTSTTHDPTYVGAGTDNRFSGTPVTGTTTAHSTPLGGVTDGHNNHHLGTTATNDFAHNPHTGTTTAHGVSNTPHTGYGGM